MGFDGMPHVLEKRLLQLGSPHNKLTIIPICSAENRLRSLRRVVADRSAGSFRADASNLFFKDTVCSGKYILLILLWWIGAPARHTAVASMGRIFFGRIFLMHP